MTKAARFLAAGAALLALCATSCATAPTAQSEAGWTTLLDAQTKGEWTVLGDSNWRLDGDAYAADGKIAGSPAAFIVTQKSYKDFDLRLEFWASEDANSGVFIRCGEAGKVSDRSCYEVNIYDQRPDPTYATGGVVHFAEVDAVHKAGGKWNTMEIAAHGRDVTVTFNGRKTSAFKSDFFLEGPIALQHGIGAIKFRKVAIRPL